MRIGLFLEFDRREGQSQADVFTEAMRQVDLAEELGLHSVWLAEHHFRPTSSVLSAPIVVASAIAGRTKRIAMGIAVYVLPLNNPVRIAEEVATLDHLSCGRFELGVGRSGFDEAYSGYNIAYSESRDRFQECLDIIVKAWTNDELNYEGEYYSFHNVRVTPKPYQQPHPPIRMATTATDTGHRIGRMGLPIFVGLRGTDIDDLIQLLKDYRHAWKEAGQPGTPDVAIRIPVYAAETMEKALSEPQESIMSVYRRLSSRYTESVSGQGTATSEERAERGQRLRQISYEDVLQKKVAFGTPDALVERFQQLQELLGLSMVVAEVNPGGRLPADRVLNSIRLLGETVVPRLS